MAGLHVPLSTLRHSPRGPSTHDWGPPWIATPSMSGVLIPFLMPVYPGAFPTFYARAADRARVACMPGTAWPVGGFPPGSSWDRTTAPVLMPSRQLSTRQQRFARARLPGPHLTRSRAPFPRRSPPSVFSRAQLEVVWGLPPQGDPRGPAILHLLRSTASSKVSYPIRPSLPRSWRNGPLVMLPAFVAARRGAGLAGRSAGPPGPTPPARAGWHPAAGDPGATTDELGCRAAVSTRRGCARSGR